MENLNKRSMFRATFERSFRGRFLNSLCFFKKFFTACIHEWQSDIINNWNIMNTFDKQEDFKTNVLNYFSFIIFRLSFIILILQCTYHNFDHTVSCDNTSRHLNPIRVQIKKMTITLLCFSNPLEMIATPQQNLGNAFLTNNPEHSTDAIQRLRLHDIDKNSQNIVKVSTSVKIDHAEWCKELELQNLSFTAQLSFFKNSEL